MFVYNTVHVNVFNINNIKLFSATFVEFIKSTSAWYAKKRVKKRLNCENIGLLMIFSRNTNFCPSSLHIHVNR